MPSAVAMTGTQRLKLAASGQHWRTRGARFPCDLVDGGDPLHAFRRIDEADRVVRGRLASGDNLLHCRKRCALTATMFHDESGFHVVSASAVR
jgi:hypothetical protein